MINNNTICEERHDKIIDFENRPKVMKKWFHCEGNCGKIALKVYIFYVANP